MSIPYVFHPRLIMRIPRFGLTTTVEDIDLHQLAADDSFMEALYLASPVLHAELLKYCEQTTNDLRHAKKLKSSVAKYFLRMSSRCTPFGLFSGCAVADWQKGPTAIMVESAIRRHTRLDMNYLCALVLHLARHPLIRKRIQYYPNSSIYTIGDELRYVENNYANGSHKHQISAVPVSDYLLAILEAARNGISFDAMVQLLIDNKGVTKRTAVAFVEELVDAQVLVNEFEPAITGAEFLNRIIDILNRINKPESRSITTLIMQLRETRRLLDNTDANTFNEIGAYKKIISHVNNIGVPYEHGKLFQVDLYFPSLTGGVNLKVKEKLLESLEAINSMNKRGSNSSLSAFARRYYERYENRQMPLLEVLDIETGIGYLENYPGDIIPLVDDMVLPGTPADNVQLQWGKKEKLLLTKLLDANVSGAYSIILTPEDLVAFKNDWEQQPPSMAVMFRLLDGEQLLLEGAGGSSAVNLLGRFAHGSKKINQIINDVVRMEEVQNPDVIFAEIVHLPESRVGNILLHPAFRQYEIPFLAMSSVAPAQQIPLQDLYICVQNNTVSIFSHKLGKQIIPRLSTAHNFSMNALPVYQFLCDLQLQHSQGGIAFTWGAIASQYKFLPRVYFKDTIISVAQWSLGEKDIKMLVGRSGNDLLQQVGVFRAKWKMPELLVLAEGDNELPVNLADLLMIEIWLDAVKNRPGFVLKEFFDSTGDAVVKGTDGAVYTNQFIAALIREQATYSAGQVVHRKENLLPIITPDFSLGSEWAYFSIFCGIMAADKLLAEAIRPLVVQLLAEGVIDKFFFIRYNNPGFHIRLRLHLLKVSGIGRLLQLFREQVSVFEEEGFIWKIQADTYKRELERYGADAMELTESLFHYDSMAVLEMLAATEANEREEIRWLWILRSIDELLDGANLNLGDKLALLGSIKDAFYNEYHVDSALKSQMSAKYRSYKAKIENIMDRSKDTGSDHETLLNILKQRTVSLAPLLEALLNMNRCGILNVPLHELLTSYIHMLVNRVVTSNPRLHELVLYDLAFTWYRSLSQRAKQQNNKDQAA